MYYVTDSVAVTVRSQALSKTSFYSHTGRSKWGERMSIPTNTYNSPFDHESHCHPLGFCGEWKTHFHLFPFSFLMSDSGLAGEPREFLLPELSLWKCMSSELAGLTQWTMPLLFDFTSSVKFAEMGCWGFPAVHDSKFLFPHFDWQFYICLNSCFLHGILGKQFVKAAAFCPSASPAWVFAVHFSNFLIWQSHKAKNEETLLEIYEM